MEPPTDADRPGPQSPPSIGIRGHNNQVFSGVHARDIHATTVVVANPDQAAAVARSLRWSWPSPIDSAPHRAYKRRGFVGRGWLFDEVRAWASSGPEQALLLTADFGVGKSAFLAALIDNAGEHLGASLPIAAHHFCDHVSNGTLAPGEFVASVAAQLAAALPAYRAAIEADDAEQLRTRLNQASKDPSSAWDQAVVAPLARIAPPEGRLLLLVDALDEALEHRPDSSGTLATTIVDLLADQAHRLPLWLRVLATSRPRDEVLSPMGQAFELRHLDAERPDNLNDLQSYALARCRQSDLAERLAAARLQPEAVAERLGEQSGGKFLYAVRVLAELASGSLPLRNRQDLDQLPAGIDAFYRKTFQRRFPSRETYMAVAPLLALLCEQREPMALGTLAAISAEPGAALESSLVAVETSLAPIEDLLRRRPSADQQGDWTLSLDHFSLEQWLSERNERGRWRAGGFAVDRAAAAERIHCWALAEVKEERAHTWPYLVRHLASHLSETERPELVARQLGRFAWLEARLRLAGINALLGDVAEAAPTDWLVRLGRALRQGAHVLAAGGEGWRGPEQLASQLLARLAEEGGIPEQSRLRQEATHWLQQAGGAPPRTASLVAPDALLRTFPVGSNVQALLTLTNGLLASSSSDGTIRLWDPAPGPCTAVFEGQQDWVHTLAVLADGRLASGSGDGTIRLWDPASGSCTAVFEGQQDWVDAMAVVGDGRLATSSDDNASRLWDPASGSCAAVFEGHQRRVNSLAVLGDGRLASGSGDNTIRLWDPAHPNGAPRVLFVADAAITALVAHPSRPLLIAGGASGRLHWLQLPEAL